MSAGGGAVGRGGSGGVGGAGAGAATWRHGAFTLRLRHTFRIARGASDTRETLFVAHHRDGIAGVGEGTPSARYGESIADCLAALPEYVARVRLPEGAVPAIDAIPCPDAPGRRALRMAVNAALHDWVAKARRAPLHELLGLVPEKAPATSFTIGIDRPEVLPDRLREGEAFSTIKVKLGGPEDEASLRAVRARTAKRIRVDANEGWSVAEAQRLIDLCTEMGVELVEQPLPAGRLEETARLRERSPIPIFADEDFRTADDAARLAGAYDGVNVKLAKCGGIGPALEAIAAAHGHGLRVLLGCMIESSVGIAAAAQISPLADFTDLDGAVLTANDPAVGLRLVEGRLLPGPRPGLGVTIRDEDLARALGVAAGRPRAAEEDPR